MDDFRVDVDSDGGPDLRATRNLDLRAGVDRGGGPDLRATNKRDLCACVDGGGYGKRWWASAIVLIASEASGYSFLR